MAYKYAGELSVGVSRMLKKKLKWNECSSYIDTAQYYHCLYVFYHRKHRDRPFYVGKAKRFGGTAASRYNSGYSHLVEGMFLNGFRLFIAPIGKRLFPKAEGYEQELIALWNPVCEQKRIERKRKPVQTEKPWNG